MAPVVRLTEGGIEVRRRGPATWAVPLSDAICVDGRYLKLGRPVVGVVPWGGELRALTLSDGDLALVSVRDGGFSAGERLAKGVTGCTLERRFDDVHILATGRRYLYLYLNTGGAQAEAPRWVFKAACMGSGPDSVAVAGYDGKRLRVLVNGRMVGEVREKLIPLAVSVGEGGPVAVQAKGGDGYHTIIPGAPRLRGLYSALGAMGECALLREEGSGLVLLLESTEAKPVMKCADAKFASGFLLCGDSLYRLEERGLVRLVAAGVDEVAGFDGVALARVGRRWVVCDDSGCREEAGLPPGCKPLRVVEGRYVVCVCSGYVSVFDMLEAAEVRVEHLAADQPLGGGYVLVDFGAPVVRLRAEAPQGVELHTVSVDANRVLVGVVDVDEEALGRPKAVSLAISAETVAGLLSTRASVQLDMPSASVEGAEAFELEGGGARVRIRVRTRNPLLSPRLYEAVVGGEAVEAIESQPLSDSVLTIEKDFASPPRSYEVSLRDPRGWASAPVEASVLRLRKPLSTASFAGVSVRNCANLVLSFRVRRLREACLAGCRLRAGGVTVPAKCVLEGDTLHVAVPVEYDELLRGRLEVEFDEEFMGSTLRWRLPVEVPKILSEAGVVARIPAQVAYIKDRAGRTVLELNVVLEDADDVACLVLESEDGRAIGFYSNEVHGKIRGAPGTMLRTEVPFGGVVVGGLARFRYRVCAGNARCTEGSTVLELREIPYQLVVRCGAGGQPLLCVRPVRGVEHLSVSVARGSKVVQLYGANALKVHEYCIPVSVPCSGRLIVSAFEKGAGSETVIDNEALVEGALLLAARVAASLVRRLRLGQLG